MTHTLLVEHDHLYFANSLEAVGVAIMQTKQAFGLHDTGGGDAFVEFIGVVGAVGNTFYLSFQNYAE